MSRIIDATNIARSSASDEFARNASSNVPIGFELLNEVRGQYALLKDPDGFYFIVVNVCRSFCGSSNYQRWVELSRHEKLLIKAFPSRLKYLAKKMLRDEERKYGRA